LTRQAIAGMLRNNPHDHVLFKLQLSELEALTKALGYEVTETFTQTSLRTKARFLFGSGKVDELSRIVEEKGVELVVLYNELTSKQKLNLSLALNCEVIDRYELTLRIFEEMASDRISKLQIELARERKLYPFYQLQAAVKYSGLERQPPWAGTGEFAFHSKLKGVQKRIGKLKREIAVLANDKMRQIKERQKLGTKMICVAGYYNAGKTTLFNLLTGENKLVGDRPFKTLSSKYQRLKSNNGVDAPLLIDTIGFVVGLDPELIKSFELNLMDMKEADLVLFLIGVDDEPEYLFHKLKFGLHLLQEIGVDSSRILIVLNKTDLLDRESFEKVVSNLNPLMEQYDWTSISAKMRDGINELINKSLGKVKNLATRGVPIAATTSPLQQASSAHPVIKANTSSSAPVSLIDPSNDPINFVHQEEKTDDEEGDFDKSPTR
jgi:GTP-binding protein HflX